MVERAAASQLQPIRERKKAKRHWERSGSRPPSSTRTIEPRSGESISCRTELQTLGGVLQPRLSREDAKPLVKLTQILSLLGNFNMTFAGMSRWLKPVFQLYRHLPSMFPPTVGTSGQTLRSDLAEIRKDHLERIAALVEGARHVFVELDGGLL